MRTLEALRSQRSEQQVNGTAVNDLQHLVDLVVATEGEWIFFTLGEDKATRMGADELGVPRGSPHLACPCSVVPKTSDCGIPQPSCTDSRTS